MIDPLNFFNGRYAVPRPDEAAFGGWDRIDGYVDPWTGYVYVTSSATGGPIIDYSSGRKTEDRKQTNLVFRSTDGGVNWSVIYQFDDTSRVPIVISSALNGRIFLYSVINGQPSLAYSQAGTGQLSFSRFWPVNAWTEENGQRENIPAAGDAYYITQMGGLATNSISRISTDAFSSRVRLSYPWVDDDGSTAIAIVNVEVSNDSEAPVVSTAALLRPSNTSHSILASTFVDPDTAGARAGNNTSVFYWIEGSTDKDQPAAVRYTVFRGADGVTEPNTVSNLHDFASPAHYVYAGSFFPDDGSANFLLQWPEAAAINASVVTIPPAPGPERFNAIWTRSSDDRPAVWGWARADFDAEVQKQKKQGFQLMEVNAFVLPGQGERFNAIWTRSSDDRPAVWGWARADFDAEVQKQKKQGFQLMEVNAFVLPGQGERFNAIWTRSSDDTPAVWGWARADFDAEVQKQKKQGFQLMEVNAFVLPGQGERFNAIWTRSSDDTPAVWGWARADFDAEVQKQKKQGFQLMEVNAFVLPGQSERFNAIWTRSSDDTPAVWGWARWDFGRHGRGLESDGFRLANLSAFLP